ncbi:ABC transporter permease [Niallia endozanthoxylica]|uniref:ABC transporter permease n=1 Tax=Niallia endozanthoxylica TaxID=2036016 RepID=A0A5J5I427_9BACI|nr:ABC transporter permease [Niallia endozanthoxylica]KAA9028404.1 ABC transporter permease [Niallia endozanthoxylica]
MSINQLILRGLKKNLKNYYLYVFALMFTVALYFAFVTLQYDPAMDETKGSIKGAAAIRTASVLLVAIVSIFLLYANAIFIKRRSKEIGLFQLVGMTKGKILQILTIENLILYFSSTLIGIFIGFSVSKLITMILFKLTKVDGIASLHFSSEAFIQTLIVFSAIYLFITLMNWFFIKKQSILSLFQVKSSTEEKVKKVSIFEMLYGIAGILLIILGYYISSKLFGGDFVTMNELFLAMVFILAAVIIGTYLFYKGSVRFIFYLIRKRKDGYLNIHQVLSLSSIMFRMKSNALLLTIITTVSALAVGLLSLSYISYYSAEENAEYTVGGDFAFTNMEDAQTYKSKLTENNIDFIERKFEVIQVEANLENIIVSNLDENLLTNDLTSMPVPVISDQSLDHIDVSKRDVLFTGYNDMLNMFLSFKDSGNLELIGKQHTFPLAFQGLQKEQYLSYYFTAGGIPAAIVDDTVFQTIKEDKDPSIQGEYSLHIGINLVDEVKAEKAAEIFRSTFTDDTNHLSRIERSNEQKHLYGLLMFIVGFLGLTFLITSGCILYFKQMDESEEEKPNYTILRKLGFTEGDLVKGIQAKQIFNFGIPLLIGLLHGYFAVQSGWFFFGTEVWTPMILVMVLYTALYSIFGILSVFYYKRVIKEAL